MWHVIGVEVIVTDYSVSPDFKSSLASVPATHSSFLEPVLHFQARISRGLGPVLIEIKFEQTIYFLQTGDQVFKLWKCTFLA